MGFDPGLSIGEEISNQELYELFKCGNMGGMRKSAKTKSLVIISDKTKGFYHDEWENGILKYTGMGKYGDQVLKGNQNQTLYYSDSNGISVFLFEVMVKAVYTFRGQVKLVSEPYQTKQQDEDGRIRNVWIFPVAPIDNMSDLANPDPAKLPKLSTKELAVRSQMISKEVKEPKISQTVVYHRDEYLKEMVKRIADGTCQLCGNPAPFEDKYGEPYLEEHHVKRLADGGTDTIDNVVAICPNCHRKVHILESEIDEIILEGVAAHNQELLKRMTAYGEAYKHP